MATQTTLSPSDNYSFQGNVRILGTLTLPNGAIAANEIAGPLPSSLLYRVWNQVLSQHGQVAAATQYTRQVLVGLAGTVLNVQAALTEAIPTGSDSVTVDVQKSTGGGAFATILAGTIVLTSSTTLRAAVGATIAAAGLVAGDMLKIVVTVSGTTSQGLLVQVDVNEQPGN